MMPWNLFKIIPSETVAKEILIFRKSKAQLVLTDLKTFGPLSFIIEKYNAVIMNRRNTFPLSNNIYVKEL